MPDAGRQTTPCWGGFDAVTFHDAHDYDGKRCPGFTGRETTARCPHCGWAVGGPVCGHPQHPTADGSDAGREATAKAAAERVWRRHNSEAKCSGCDYCTVAKAYLALIKQEVTDA